MNLAAGDEAGSSGSSLRFFADDGDEGMFLRVLVVSPRILFWGSLEGAIVNDGWDSQEDGRKVNKKE
ncbi:MAG: hypothetical protein CL912_12565 [Deltaproteobacteria bacterium]|nr:hypothetical protein [Deltaproteobacteria bacterium]